jgi:hypothetical protein
VSDSVSLCGTKLWRTSIGGAADRSASFTFDSIPECRAITVEPRYIEVRGTAEITSI